MSLLKRLFKQPQQEPAKTIKILYIEDDIDDVYLIQQLLAEDLRAHYAVTHATHFAEAAKSLKTVAYDLILLDLSVDHKKDLEALEYSLDELALDKIHIPIVILTGADDDELGEQAISCGASDYLPKRHATTFLLSRSIRYAMERHSLSKKLIQQARYDELTGLYNRPETMRRCQNQFEHCRRTPINMALCLIDLNNFKPINDTYGHQAGDEVLRFIGSRLRNCTRRTDIAGRLGGDEFLVLLTYYESESILMETVTTLKQKLEESVTCFIGQNLVSLPVQVSIGIAPYNPPESLRKTISIADKAMYQSKSQGGAVVCANRARH